MIHEVTHCICIHCISKVKVENVRYKFVQLLNDMCVYNMDKLLAIFIAMLPK